jgi:cell division inhibitor SepF
MAKLLNRMLNLVGWEAEEADEADEIKDEVEEESYQPPRYLQTFTKKPQPKKVVSMNPGNQFKVVIMQPETFDDARDVCDHLKNKKPIVVNLENLNKETAQRVIDFLSGSVYGLDGDIQKVSSNIFLIAPSNVDIMGAIRDEFKSKAAFPWMRY